MVWKYNLVTHYLLNICEARKSGSKDQKGGG